MLPIIVSATEGLPSLQEHCFHSSCDAVSHRVIPSLLPGRSSPLPPGLLFLDASARRSRKGSATSRMVPRARIKPENLPAFYGTVTFQGANSQNSHGAHIGSSTAFVILSVKRARGSPPPLASAYPLEQTRCARHRTIPSLGPSEFPSPAGRFFFRWNKIRARHCRARPLTALA